MSPDYVVASGWSSHLSADSSTHTDVRLQKFTQNYWRPCPSVEGMVIGDALVVLANDACTDCYKYPPANYKLCKNRHTAYHALGTI